jgi:ubiquinone/menaquinone biosynthesis C-methylase UbiE
MSTKLGKFGEFVKQYEKARKPYPPEVFAYLKKLSSANDPNILDLGCGTGISTRQLAKVGRVIGCDPDPIMLRAAKNHKRINKEKYVLGKAEKLPFKNQTFDVVTAFSAFHWFNNDKSIKEIRRVLKPGGIVFSVSKAAWKNWGEGYRRTIIKSIHQEIASFVQDKFNPVKEFKKYKFSNITAKEWNESEIISSVNDGLVYVQSISIWKTVPKNLRPTALLGLREYFKDLKKRTGKIERKFKVKVVAGRK